MHCILSLLVPNHAASAIGAEGQPTIPAHTINDGYLVKVEPCGLAASDLNDNDNTTNTTNTNTTNTNNNTGTNHTNHTSNTNAPTTPTTTPTIPTIPTTS